jgi:hypothetical protein
MLKPGEKIIRGIIRRKNYGEKIKTKNQGT